MKLFAPIVVFFLALSKVALASQLRTVERKRELQSFGDDFTFNFDGRPITLNDAGTQCITEWRGLLSCILSDCPNFEEVCPETYPPVFKETSTMCGKFQSGYCQNYDLPDCCMMDCMEQSVALWSCVVQDVVGLNRDVDECISIQRRQCFPYPDPILVEPEFDFNVTITGKEYNKLVYDVDALSTTIENLRGRVKSMIEEQV